MGVRYGGAKRGKYCSGIPNASSGEKNMATCVAETRAQLALRTPYGHSFRFMSITYFFVPFLFIVIEPGCYRSILFIIWLNCYGHHIGYLTYQWDNILNRRSNNLSHVYDLSFSFISAIFLPFFLFFLTWLNC